jgi:MFS family permease
MGQSSMYRATYPRGQMGRVLGLLIFANFATMVPTVLFAGWVCDHENDPTAYRWLYPAAAVMGLVACRFYAAIRVPRGHAARQPQLSLLGGLEELRRVMIQDRAYVLFQFAFFLSGSAFFLSAHVVIDMAHDRLGFGAIELSLWLSVVPQLMLAFCSPVWGVVLDRIGIVRARLLISVIMTVYLVSYFGAISAGVPGLILLGSLLRGVSEGGGQVTWAMASSHFAPRPEDVPVYNGIHFVLNGIRGLVMPFVGSLLALGLGAGTVLVATAVSAASVYVIARSLRQGDGGGRAPVLRLAPPGHERAAKVG